MRSFRTLQGEDAGNMYESIKVAVTARQAAESFGLTVNRSGMATCPFHEDHTPSLKLDQRYYCFGCGATGDVIDFTSRLLNVSNSNVAQILAERFGINPESQTVTTPKIKLAASLRNLEQRCLFALVQYEKLLRFRKKHYAPQTPEEPFRDRFVEGCQQESFIAHLIDEMMDADPWRRNRVVELLLEDEHLHRLQNYVSENQEEEMKMNVCKGNEESGNGGYCS